MKRITTSPHYAVKGGDMLDFFRNKSILISGKDQETITDTVGWAACVGWNFIRYNPKRYIVVQTAPLEKKERKMFALIRIGHEQDEQEKPVM